MDKNQEHLNNLSEIRSLMERSSSFLSLSGLSGISAGIIGLITSVYVYSKIDILFEHNRDYVNSESGRHETVLFFILLAVLVLALTFGSVIFFTARKARKKGLPVWNSSAKRLVISLFIPLVAGGIFCLILTHHYLYMLIAPSMLLFFGLALLNAGKYTFSEIRILGVSEIILGLAASFWTEYGLYFWAIGFGLLNIIYGAYMYFKYER
jgi:hypothetical protein